MKAHQVRTGISPRGFWLVLLVGATAAQGSLFGPLSSRYVVGDPNRTNPLADTEGPKCIAAADLNGDGRADVITGNLDGTVSVLLARDDGTLESQRLFTVGGSNRAVVTADFDADGRLDVAVADVTGSVRILTGDGQGRLSLAQTIPTGPARALAAGDCNGDQAIDLLVACSPADCGRCAVCSDRSLCVLYGRGDGSFGPPTYLLDNYPGCFYQVALADIDLDGCLDALALDLPGGNDGQGQLLLLAGRPSGGFQTPTKIMLHGRGPRDFCLAYVDERLTGDQPPANARLDVVVAHRDSATLEILLGRAGSGFAPSRTIAAGDSPRSVAAGDLNGDGLADLVVANRNVNTISVLRGLGSGWFSPPCEFPSGTSPRSVVLADLTGDGALDAAVINRLSEDVAVFIGRRGLAGFLVPDGYYPAGLSPVDVVAADFNEDGRPDVASVSRRSHDVRVRLNQGDGGLGAESVYPAGYDPSCMATADLNGDGHVDLVVAAMGTSTGTTAETQGAIVSLLGRGNGTFQTPAATTGTDASFRPHWLRVGDLDGDGQIDVAIGCVNGRVLAARGRGDGSFETPVTLPFPVEGTPITLTLGDFNNDGRPDIATSRCRLLLNDGQLFEPGWSGSAQVFLPPEARAPTDSWVIESADLDKDGYQDIILTLTFHKPDPVALFFGNGDGTFSEPDIYSGPDQGVVDLVAEDMDGDGLVDLVIGNRCGADVRILTGTGNRRFSYTESMSTYSVEGIAVCDLDGDGRPDVTGAGLGVWTILSSRPPQLVEPGPSNLAGIPPREGLYLNEVMSTNRQYFRTDKDRSPDLIEVYNYGDYPIPLGGCTLRQQTWDGDSRTWEFPAEAMVGSRAYLVVLCDSKKPQLSTPAWPWVWCDTFRLSSSGESLALVDATDQVLDQVDFPAMPADVSYARFVDGGRYFCYNPVPSLGAPNIRPANLTPSVEPANPWVSADGTTLGVTARTFDDIGIAYACAIVRIKGRADSNEVILCDDGAHGDGEAGDGLLAATLGPLPPGSTLLYGFRVVDLEGSVGTYPADLSVEADLLRVTLPREPSPLRLNELVADNQTGLTDERDHYEDWLEILNEGPGAVSLANVALINDYFDSDPNNVYVFPAASSLAQGQRLVVFCDGDIYEGPLHAPWGLSRAGDSVVLVQLAPDGTRVLLDNLSFGPLPADTAFGRPNDRDPAAILDHPTPGQPNSGLPAAGLP
jgi:hypothetical protein